MKVKIGDAARLAGVSRSTLHRALKAGRISFETDEHGDRWIDPAEIARVYAETVGTAPRDDQRHDTTQPLEREVVLLRDMIDDLRRRLDASEEERRQLSQRLLLDQRPWWRRWRG